MKLTLPRWVAPNLTEEEKASLAELDAMPDEEPVETSDYMKAKVASEQALNDAASTRLLKKKRLAEAAEKSRTGTSP